MDASTTHAGNGAAHPEIEPVAEHETSAYLPVPIPKPAPRFTATPNDLMEIGATLFQEAEDRLQGSRKRHLRVRLGNKTLAEIPLATGAIGVLAAAMVAVALTRLTIDFE